MAALATSRTHFYPLDPKNLFWDAPRVLDGPPGYSEFQDDYYIFSNIKILINVKKFYCEYNLRTADTHNLIAKWATSTLKEDRVEKAGRFSFPPL